MIRRRAIVGGAPAAVAAAASGLVAPAGLAAQVVSRTIVVTPAAELSADERARHERHMARALELAEGRPGPFASVIVQRQTGEVVCEGVNKRNESPIFHGEIVAIDTCARVEPEVSWSDLALYTTAEPCPMCMSAIVWTRIPEVVYGTSIETLALLGINQIRLDSPTVAAAAPFYGGRIVGGVLEDRADAMYREWAARRRR